MSSSKKGSDVKQQESAEAVENSPIVLTSPLPPGSKVVGYSLPPLKGPTFAEKMAARAVSNNRSETSQTSAETETEAEPPLRQKPGDCTPRSAMKKTKPKQSPKHHDKPKVSVTTDQMSLKGWLESLPPGGKLEIKLPTDERKRRSEMSYEERFLDAMKFWAPKALAELKASGEWESVQASVVERLEETESLLNNQQERNRINSLPFQERVHELTRQKSLIDELMMQEIKEEAMAYAPPGLDEADDMEGEQVNPDMQEWIDIIRELHRIGQEIYSTDVLGESPGEDISQDSLSISSNESDLEMEKRKVREIFQGIRDLLDDKHSGDAAVQPQFKAIHRAMETQSSKNSTETKHLNDSPTSSSQGWPEESWAEMEDRLERQQNEMLRKLVEKMRREKQIK